MTKCALKNCKNASSKQKKNDGVSYFKFPQNEIQREKWRQIVAEERGDEYFKPNDTSVVCSDHFLPTDIYYSSKGKKMKNKSAFPQLKVSFIQPAGRVQPCSSNTAGNISGSTNASESEHVELMKSSTSSGASSLLDAARISFLQIKLRETRRKLEIKTKQVKNLARQNERLKNKCAIFKKVINSLKEGKFANEVLVLEDQTSKSTE